MGRATGSAPRKKVRLIFVGAHPDDADFCCLGTAIRLIEGGHEVLFLSLTDGSAGHQEQGGAVLARRRYDEAQQVARSIGLTYRVLDNPDGGLEASLANRNALVTLIREFRPSVVITHRPNDYHTDHRHTSLLVQDAAYLLGVPHICPLTPRLERLPVILYAWDPFRKPWPFSPDLLVDITEVYGKKLKTLCLHESQLFEWLPFVEGFKDDPPREDGERLKWVDRHWGYRTEAGKFRELLRAHLPGNPGVESIRHVEAFEVCEYGGRLDADGVRELLPFAIYLPER